MMLGDKIHDYRISIGMTIQQFAEKLDVQPTIVDDWETHKALPRVEELVKIEQAFGISVDTLLSDKPIQTPPVTPVQPQPVQPQPVQPQPVQPQPVQPQQPIYGQPVQPQQPIYGQPVQQPIQQPHPQPQYAPVYTQPMQQPMQQPVYRQPVYGQPVQPGPVYGQPVYAPVYNSETHIYHVSERKEKPVPGGLKALSWITFAFSIASIFIALIIDDILLELGINTILPYYISLLFPQASIIAFIILKVKGHRSVKNLILGIVFTCLLLLIILLLSSGEANVGTNPDFSI